MARKSILDLKSKTRPLPLAAFCQLDNGRWQVGLMLPRAQEPIIFDRPTRRGAENELIHQCRKRRYQGWREWTDLQEAWDGQETVL